MIIDFIDFMDSDEIYARIETEENPDKIEELLKKFKDEVEPEGTISSEYEISNFLKYLHKNDLTFSKIAIEPDLNIYF